MMQQNGQDVLAAFAKRRQVDDMNSDAMIEILSEQAIGYVLS